MNWVFKSGARQLPPCSHRDATAYGTADHAARPRPRPCKATVSWIETLLLTLLACPGPDPGTAARSALLSTCSPPTDVGQGCMAEKTSIANVAGSMEPRAASLHHITSGPRMTSDRNICVVSTNAHARHVSSQFAILGPQRTKKRRSSERRGLYQSLVRWRC